MATRIIVLAKITFLVNVATDIGMVRLAIRRKKIYLVISQRNKLAKDVTLQYSGNTSRRKTKIDFAR